MKVNPFTYLAIVLVTFSVSGCVTQPMYSWGAYEMNLYKYYKNPADLEKFGEKLVADFEYAEEKGLVVAPGLYAEYGYLLTELERHEQAVVYFEKEKAAWPESTLLMDKMIASAQG